VTGKEALSVAERYATYLTRPVASVAADLESYARLLLKWQRIQNLVSRETVAELWPRHMADSLQLTKFLPPDDSLNLLDLGSGGGFPALPLAIARKGKLKATLVESNARKASFLRTVARELQLDVAVLAERSEAVNPQSLGTIDVVTARALADLDLLCALAAPFFAPKTKALFLKGREHVEEIRETRARWDFDVLIEKSDTDVQGAILEISNLRLKTAS
jgi:16S rRNA (guanine527-N7)-methyltransferase